jgi:hypothetical protein
VLVPGTARKLVQELDQLFDRARKQPDLQVQSDYAKFLVIRVSGLVEQVVTEIVLAYTQPQANPTVTAHVAWRMNSFQNPNIERILQLVGSFNSNWREQLEYLLTVEERQALSSINLQRNKIAHGQQSTVSLGQVDQYYAQIKALITKIAGLF